MATRLRSDRDYAAWIVGGILLVVLAGFSRSFFLMPMFGAAPDWAAKESIFYLHGFVFSGWFALLAVQTYLIRSRSLKLHRRLGYAGAAFGVVVVFLGAYSALLAANRPGGFIGVPFPPEQFLIVPLLDVTLFGVFLALAVIGRADPPRHKRFILLGSISLLEAPMARIPAMMPALPMWYSLVVFVLFIGAMVAWDLDTRRRVRPETLWGGLAILGLKLFELPMGASTAWQGFARTLMSFAGPP